MKTGAGRNHSDERGKPTAQQSIERLKHISSVLEAFEDLYLVEQAALLSAEKPHARLSELAALLEAFEKGLQGLFSREERSMDQFAPCLREGESFIAMLKGEHKEALARIKALRVQFQLLSGIDSESVEWTTRAKELADSLRSVLEFLSAHLCRRDAIDFVIDHNL